MLSLLGIRHHGPGSARSVLAALDELQPDVVLIESPADTAPALTWIDKGLVPPVALLGWVVADPGRAAFVPFAEFSPEWQAISWALARDIPVDAIDLPLGNTLAVERDDTLFEFDPAIANRPADPIGALATAAGQSDPERWWDDVIEHRGDGLATFDAVGEAMTAVREGTVTSPFEERREAHMRKRIRAALKSHDRVVVVCGAWHVPALDVTAKSTAITAAADAATLRGLPKAKVAISWVPWTHERLAVASGYGAGVRSPGWYDHLFTHHGEDAIPHFFVKAARVLREHDLAASPDDLIAASRLTDALAAMRDRPHPGLDEVLDAADAVMGGLPLVRRQLVVGSAVGSVPDGAPQVPLARDLARRQKSARLRVTEDESTVELDLRTPNGLRRSHLLHQLDALGIGWGAVTESRGSTGTFRETWTLRWSPELAVRVIERAAYGTTVETAATARLIEVAHGAASIGEVASALERALLADLGDAIADIVGVLGTRAATDPDVIALMGALEPLADSQRYGDVRSTDVEAIRAVFDGLVVRVLAGLPTATRSLDEEAARTVIERLSRTQRALALVDHPERHRRFPEVLAQLARPGHGNGLVQGRATRLLNDAGDWNTRQVANRFSQALSPGTPPADGAAFVEGFLAGSGTVLLHDADLRTLLDTWLTTMRPEAFEATVALLRRTFGAFAAAERRQLGRILVDQPLSTISAYGDELDADRLDAVVTTVRRMLGVPV